MKVKVFYPDKNGKISFTKEELQALLDEVYKEGYNDARPYYWTTPSWTYRDSNTYSNFKSNRGLRWQCPNCF